MNKQVYAALSLVCGLLGFNLIAIVQSLSYLRVKQYQLSNEAIDLSLFTVDSLYKNAAIVLGVVAVVLYLLYKRTGEKEAIVFAGLGAILGIMSLLLGIFEAWQWLV